MCYIYWRKMKKKTWPHKNTCDMAQHWKFAEQTRSIYPSMFTLGTTRTKKEKIYATLLFITVDGKNRRKPPASWFYFSIRPDATSFPHPSFWLALQLFLPPLDQPLDALVLLMLEGAFLHRRSRLCCTLLAEIDLDEVMMCDKSQYTYSHLIHRLPRWEWRSPRLGTSLPCYPFLSLAWGHLAWWAFPETSSDWGSLASHLRPRVRG